MVTVALYGPVREAAGTKHLEVDASTVDGALAAVFAEWPSLEAVVMDGEGFAPQVNVFVDGRKLATLDGLETTLEGGETVQITAAMSGG